MLRLMAVGLPLIGMVLSAWGCGPASEAPAPTAVESTATPEAGATSEVVVGTAVGGSTSPPLRDITPVQPPDNSGVVLTPDATGTVTVTLADQGSTVEMKVGDRLRLALEDGYDWTVTIADTTLLRAVMGEAMLYQAARPGQTPLNAVGELPCHKAIPPCEAPSRLFSLTVIVR